MTSEASIQRVEAQWTSLQLSEVPPSANNLFAHGMHGRFKTPAYKAWLTLAGHEINRQKPPRVAGAYALTLRFGRTRKRRDLDNCIKPVSDLLVSHSIVSDDALCREISACWVAEPGVHVMVVSTREAA